jgi:hypothetical protein
LIVLNPLAVSEKQGNSNAPNAAIRGQQTLVSPFQGFSVDEQ